MTPYTVPLIAAPQKFTISLSGTTYTFTLNYRQVPEWVESGNDDQLVMQTGYGTAVSTDTDDGGWVLDIGDANNAPIIQGIPLVTGANLLAQYAYLGIIGALWVQTLSNPDAVPTYQNLGSDGLLFYVTTP
jgi:hypothetical protein